MKTLLAAAATLGIVTAIIVTPVRTQTVTHTVTKTQVETQIVTNTVTLPAPVYACSNPLTATVDSKAGNRLDVTLSVGGQSATGMLDTGAWETSLPDAWISSYPIIRTATMHVGGSNIQEHAYAVPANVILVLAEHGYRPVANSTQTVEVWGTLPGALFPVLLAPDVLRLGAHLDMHDNNWTLC